MEAHRVIGNRFQIDDPERDLLGRGGMGDVYRGRDLQTGQAVAIKALRPEVVTSDPDAVTRFVREGEALRQLNHPNIVQMVDAVEQDGRHYLVMEYVSGGSLRDLLEKQGRLSIERTVEVALDVADALTRAHRLGIVHRDLKPSNVLLAEDGTPRLTDFGHAHLAASPRLTQTGTVLGTVLYLSPEACRGEALDARADIWAFGATLYEMLSGQVPFGGETFPAVFMAILSQPTPDLSQIRPDAPDALADLVYRMLEKDRGQRIPSVRLVGAELEAIIRGTSPELRPTPHLVAAVSRFATPTPVVLGVPKHNLPTQPTLFVGREVELIELAKLFADPNVRLVTILGPGGMGKTRLALQAAEAQLRCYADGVFFVPLAPLRSAEDILPTVAEAMSFQFYPGGEPAQQLLGFLGEKQMLLVIDNFEHVLDGAGVVNEILRAAPGVKVLATSREKLNLQPEIRFRLGGMDFPASMPAPATKDAADLGNWVEYGAVKLFLQSAQRARPGFELDAADLGYVIRICQLVEGIPLGILLAAAWVEMFSPVEIVDEIRQSLDFLETELRDVPERHRSMRAVLESSWNRLLETERKIFKKLSVFRGGFRRPAAQAVAGTSLRILVSLASKSLLRRDPASGRYEMHELLRQYAGEQLEVADQVNSTRDAHGAYYMEWMAQRQMELRGQRQITALDEIEADFENVRQAWHWAVKQKNYAAIDRASESLYAFCDMRSRAHEGEALFQQARRELAPQPGQAPHPAWSRVLLPWYDLRMYLGRLESHHDIIAQAESSLAAAQKRGDRSTIAHGLALLGTIAEHTGDFGKAVTLYEQSLSHDRELDDFFWITIRIGLCYQAKRQYAKAIGFFQQSLDRGREIGDQVKIAWSSHNLGDTVILTADYAGAESYWQEANDLFRRIGTLEGVVRTSADLSLTAFLSGEAEKAETLAKEALEIASEINYIPSGYDTARTMLGWVAIVSEDYTEGRERLEEVLVIEPTLFDANLGLCFVACGLEEYQTAEQHLEAVLKSASTSRTLAMAIMILPAAAIVLAAHKGRGEQAVEWLALAFHHPASPAGLMEKWPLLARLRANLEAELGSAVYRSAWQRGQEHDLQAALAALPEQFGGERAS